MVEIGKIERAKSPVPVTEKEWLAEQAREAKRRRESGPAVPWWVASE